MKKASLILILTLFLFGCQTDDDSLYTADNYLNANLQGVLFSAKNDLVSTNFKRTITSRGSLNLLLRGEDANGDLLEIYIENYEGPGKYHIGSDMVANHWIGYSQIGGLGTWKLTKGMGIDLNTNYVEIISLTDESLEGRFSCSRIFNVQTNKASSFEGNFKVFQYLP